MDLKVIEDRGHAVIDAAYGGKSTDGVTAFAVLLAAFVSQARVLSDEGILREILQTIVGDKE